MSISLLHKINGFQDQTGMITGEIFVWFMLCQFFFTSSQATGKGNASLDYRGIYNLMRKNQNHRIFKQIQLRYTKILYTIF